MKGYSKPVSQPSQSSSKIRVSDGIRIALHEAKHPTPGGRMLMRRLVIAVAASAVVVAASGCGSGTTTPTTPSTPAITAATVTIQPAARTLATAAFVPNPVTVSQGATV